MEEDVEDEELLLLSGNLISSAPPPPPVKVVSRRGRGRCLVATRAIRAGEGVFSEAPLVTGPSSSADVSSQPSPARRCVECGSSMGIAKRTCVGLVPLCNDCSSCDAGKKSLQVSNTWYLRYKPKNPG